MKYTGKLFGHLGGKRYFDTGKTSEDWDRLESDKAELLEMLKRGIDKIHHLKYEYKDVGHAVKFLNEARQLIEKATNTETK